MSQARDLANAQLVARSLSERNPVELVIKHGKSMTYLGVSNPPTPVPIKPLFRNLKPAQLASVTDPQATEDLILSYKAELQEARRQLGVWELRALTVEPQLEALTQENERLRNLIAGITKANKELNRRVHGPQPIEVAR